MDVNGHWKKSKTKQANAPADAGSARDMLAAGAGAGASSGAAADPRAAVEAAVSAAPDDPSEGDKLNLTINIASASATDMMLGACPTCACRSAPPPAATFSELVLPLSCITDCLRHACTLVDRKFRITCLHTTQISNREREERERARERKSNLQQRARPTDAVQHFLHASFLTLHPRVISVCVCVCVRVCCVHWGVVSGSRHPS